MSLWNRIQAKGWLELWAGALTGVGASILASLAWWMVFNFMSATHDRDISKSTRSQMIYNAQTAD